MTGSISQIGFNTKRLLCIPGCGIVNREIYKPELQMPKLPKVPKIKDVRHFYFRDRITNVVSKKPIRALMIVKKMGKVLYLVCLGANHA